MKDKIYPNIPDGSAKALVWGSPPEVTTGQQSAPISNGIPIKAVDQSAAVRKLILALLAPELSGRLDELTASIGVLQAEKNKLMEMLKQIKYKLVMASSGNGAVTYIVGSKAVWVHPSMGVLISTVEPLKEGE